MDEKRIDILGLGTACIDDFLIVETFPKINEKIPVLEVDRRCGGLTGTALVAASRLGCKCGQVIRLDDREISNFIRDALVKEGMTLFEQNPEGGVTPYHSVIIVEKSTGERSILGRPPHNTVPDFGEREFALLDRTSAVYVDFYFAAKTRGIVAAARDKGLPVIGDFEGVSEGSAELMTLVDHLIVPLAFAQSVTNAAGPVETAAALARQPGRAVACVTDGERGSWYATGDRPDEVRHFPAFVITDLVDTTGCGDVFHGAYAASLVQGYPLDERIRRAAGTAALKAKKLGAQQGAPTTAELEAFLKNA